MCENQYTEIITNTIYSLVSLHLDFATETEAGRTDTILFHQHHLLANLKTTTALDLYYCIVSASALTAVINTCDEVFLNTKYDFY